MGELREIFDFGELQIITEKSKLPKYALAKLSYSFARADSENANKRTYSEKILSREINRKSEELRKGKVAGMLEHPFSGITRLDKVAHILNGVSYDRRTKLASAESFVLDTSKGRDFMVMLDSGLKMGCSMRGFGNVFNGKIQSDYKFDTVDFVLHPSFGSDATIDQSNIIESANSIFDDSDDKNNENKEMKDKMMGLSEDYVQSMIESVYGLHIDEEIFSGSLEDFKKEKETRIRAEILVAHKYFESIEEALKHLGAEDEIKKISSPPVQRKVTPADVYYEAKMAGVDPKVYADMLNKNLEEKEKSDGEKSIRIEIERAGILSGRPKLVPKEEVYPDGQKRIVYVSEEREAPQQTAERIKEKVNVLKEGAKITEEEAFIKFAMGRGLVEETARFLWKERQEEKKRMDKITSNAFEKSQAGFGSEIRPSARKRSQKIIEEGE